MKTNILCFLITVFFGTSLFAQNFGCGTKKRAVITTRGACSAANIYSIAAIDINNTPIKTIRVSVHVFQRSNGTGNLNPLVNKVNTQGLNLMDAINAGSRDANGDFWWLKGAAEGSGFYSSEKMNVIARSAPEINSPAIKDTKIRVQVVAIYVWRDDVMWRQSEKYDQFDYTGGDAMYNYVMNKTISHRNNSLHLFFPGQHHVRTGGVASGVPNKLWSVYTNSFVNRYPTGVITPTPSNYYMNGLIAHEIGHNLGLDHTAGSPSYSVRPINGDDCNDTPENANCFNVNTPNSPACDHLSKISNNVMDYNSTQIAFTQCQVQTMHSSLLNNIGNLRDIMVETITPTIPAIAGPNCMGSLGGTFAVSNYQAGTEASWSVSPASAVKVASGCGQVAVLTPNTGVTGNATITFKIVWDNGRTTMSNKTFSLSPPVITGNYYGPRSGILNTNNVISLGSTNVRVSIPNATSFKWTRISGNATWTGGSGTYTGSSIDFNLTSTNSSIAFQVVAQTTNCGTITQTFSFSTNSWSFRAAPNPATSTLRISGTQITQPTSRVAEAPLKFELRLYDKYGQIVKYAKNVTGVTDVDIDISGLKPDIYQLQIFKDKELTNQRIEIRR